MRKNMRLKLHYQKKRAFTLIELVVTLFIASIVIGIFTMLLDFSFKSLDTAHTANENLDTAIHIVNLISEEINSAQEIFSDEDFVLYKPYKNSLGFMLRLKKKDNYTYAYYAYRDGNIYRLAKNTTEEDASKVSFSNYDEFGLNAIVENVSSIDGTGYDNETGLITLNFKITNNTTEEYRTQVYAMRKNK